MLFKCDPLTQDFHRDVIDKRDIRVNELPQIFGRLLVSEDVRSAKVSDPNRPVSFWFFTTRSSLTYLTNRWHGLTSAQYAPTTGHQ